ncbi:META domain-containing protein [Pedobacter sp. SYSU D00535]|uniref:META domain-containing protein n=1 Tax=Pedobacter sp. SYSU D00535 TaxID=2810308 RepID=UPI001A970D22|nr:META domain-containing protein [Pedobacter sp. SYSU D00535]
MRYFLLAIALITLTNCNALKPDRGILSLGGQKWTLTAIAHKPVDGSGKAVLEFDEKELEVKGKAFCNSISAEFELMGSDQITFQDIVSTKMYCEGLMDEEQELLSNLREVRRYDIKNGMLYLYSTDVLLLTFRK